MKTVLPLKNFFSWLGNLWCLLDFHDWKIEERPKPLPSGWRKARRTCRRCGLKELRDPEGKWGNRRKV